MIEEQNSEKTDQAAGKLIQGTAALPKVPAKLKTGIPVPDQPPEPADAEAASFSEPVSSPFSQIIIKAEPESPRILIPYYGSGPSGCHRPLPDTAA